MILLLLTMRSIAGAQAAPTPPAGSRYAPPDLPAVAKNQLDVLSVEIAQENIGDAARRIDSLIKDSPNGLIAFDEKGGQISLSTWIGQLPEAQRAALSREYRVQFEDAASRMVRQLSDRTSTEPAQLLAIARRYPFAPAATDAIVAAAKRSEALGDSLGANDLFALAHARGWKDKLRWNVVTPATKPGKNSYTGPIPFQASWFASLASAGSPSSTASAVTLQEDRLMPSTSGGVIYLCTSKGAVAIKEEANEPIWLTTPGDDGPPTSTRPPSRGATFAPALFCDDAGAARIVVVRQMGATGEYELRAMRASDGKQIWSTDASSEIRGVTIASNPAIAGRYIYALAADSGEQADRLVMLALDITSGKVLWRSDIGSVTRRSGGRFNRSRDPVLDVLDPWQNISAPCVDADTVYIAPNCGAVIAVDRFDGSIRWIREYPTTGRAPEPARSARQRVNVRTRELPSTGIPRASVFRWNTTPVRVGGNLLVIAPQDSDRVFALDARTGKPEWHTDSLASATLFGAAGKLVYVSDKSITALDIEKLESAWSWEGGAVGPATLVANQILVPTAGGLVTLNATDGAVAAGSKVADVPDLLALTKVESLRAALDSTGVLALLASDDGSSKASTSTQTPTPTNKRTR